MDRTDAAQAAVRQAEAEGLTLQPSDNAAGYRSVRKDDRTRSENNPFTAVGRGGSEGVYLGCFATAEEAALAVARAHARTRPPSASPRPAVAKRAAPPARLTSLPVVVFSHGLTASRETSQSLALSLAANGALVVLLEHTDRSGALARLLDGTVIPFDAALFALGTDPPTAAYLDARRLQTALRVEDVRRHLAVLQSVHRDDGEASLSFDGLSAEEGASVLAGLKGRLNLGQVALGGHSFGGCTVLTLACEMMLAARRDPSDAPQALRAGKVAEGQYEDVALGAIFSLDPALDWLPRSIQTAMGHEAPAVPTPATRQQM